MKRMIVRKVSSTVSIVDHDRVENDRSSGGVSDKIG